MALANITYVAVAGKHGKWPGVAAAALAVVVGSILVVLFYRWRWRCDEQRLAEVREKYPNVYVVKALPADPTNIVKPQRAEIRIGDYGWEARPIRKDGLIYLEGLTRRWQVVWHAGFRPEQIEKVAAKPTSQYDFWVPEWVKLPPLPPCPYPVLERTTPTMGLPHHSMQYWVDYPSQAYQSPDTKEV